MPDIFYKLHEFFSLVTLVILEVALIAFLIVGIWRILRREVNEARKPASRTNGTNGHSAVVPPRSSI